MNYLIKLLIFVILYSTAIIYSQSKRIGNQSFTLGQNFDEIKFRDTIQWGDTTDVDKGSLIGIIWKDGIQSVDGTILGNFHLSNGKIIDIQKSWDMRVNPNEAISLFNVIWDVCEIVFGERSDDLTIELSELKEPTISSKQIEIMKFSPIDDKHYLDEGVTISSFDKGSHTIEEYVSLRSYDYHRQITKPLKK